MPSTGPMAPAEATWNSKHPALRAPRGLTVPDPLPRPRPHARPQQGRSRAGPQLPAALPEAAPSWPAWRQHRSTGEAESDFCFWYCTRFLVVLEQLPWAEHTSPSYAKQRSAQLGSPQAAVYFQRKLPKYCIILSFPPPQWHIWEARFPSWQPHSLACLVLLKHISSEWHEWLRAPLH